MGEGQSREYCWITRFVRSFHGTQSKVASFHLMPSLVCPRPSSRSPHTSGSAFHVFCVLGFLCFCYVCHFVLGIDEIVDGMLLPIVRYIPLPIAVRLCIVVQFYAYCGTEDIDLCTVLCVIRKIDRCTVSPILCVIRKI